MNYGMWNMEQGVMAYIYIYIYIYIGNNDEGIGNGEQCIR